MLYKWVFYTSQNIEDELKTYLMSWRVVKNLFNTLEVADRVFKENIKIKKFLSNLIYFLHLALNQYFKIISTGYLSLVSFLFVLVFVCFVFCFLIWYKNKNTILLKSFDHCNWLLSELTLVIMPILVSIIYYIASVILNLGVTLWNISDGIPIADSDDPDSLMNDTHILKC